MDCVDCHNRATHIFENPDDRSTRPWRGHDRRRPAVHQAAGVEVLDKKYATEEEAATAIAARGNFYKTNIPMCTPPGRRT